MFKYKNLFNTRYNEKKVALFLLELV